MWRRKVAGRLIEYDDKSDIGTIRAGEADLGGQGRFILPPVPTPCRRP